MSLYRLLFISTAISLVSYANELSVVDSRFVKNFYISENGTLQFRVSVKTHTKQVEQYKLYQKIIDHTLAIGNGNTDINTARQDAKKSERGVQIELIYENGFYNAYRLLKNSETSFLEESSTVVGPTQKDAENNVKLLFGQAAFEEIYYIENNKSLIKSFYLSDYEKLQAINLSECISNDSTPSYYSAPSYYSDSNYSDTSDTENLNSQLKDCAMIQFDQFKIAKDELTESYSNFDEVFLNSNLSTTKFAFQISDLSHNDDDLKFYLPFSKAAPKQLLLYKEIPNLYLKNRVDMGFIKTSNKTENASVNYAFEFKIVLADTKDINNSELPSDIISYPVGETQSCLVKSKDYIKKYFKNSFEHLNNIMDYEKNMLRARADKLKK